MPDEVVLNCPERPEYFDVLRALKPILYDLPPKIIAIDGRSGTGKTTLGRFLAWRFNVTLIETDLFRKEGFIYHNEQVDTLIRYRMNRERPIIVEGLVVLRLLSELKHEPAYHIRVICDESEPSAAVEEEWNNYVKVFHPNTASSLVVELPAIR